MNAGYSHSDPIEISDVVISVLTNYLDVGPDLNGKGAELVRLTFNPSGNAAVGALKGMAATYIDMVEMAKHVGADPRECAEAITCIQTASMFAVAALTKNT